MPTGYTARVSSGEVADLRTFALECARGMGALITLRDEPWDAPIPERLEPSTGYHDEALAKAKAALKELPALTGEECEERAAAEFAEECARYAERIESRRICRNNYNAMLAKVVRWETEAEGIKSFMLDQLRQSIDFDCGGSHDMAPEKLSGEAWREARLTKARRDVDYHTAERAKELERTEARNAWLAALRESLPEPETAPA